MTKHFNKILNDSDKLLSDIVQRAIEDYTGQSIGSINPSRIHTSTISGAPDTIYIYVDREYIGNITRQYNSDWKRLSIKFHPPGPVDNGPPEPQLVPHTHNHPTDLDHLVTFLTHSGTSPVVNDLSSEKVLGSMIGAKLIRLSNRPVKGSAFEATICKQFDGAFAMCIDYIFTSKGKLINIDVRQED